MIGRFGSLNDSDGGHSYRYSVSADYRASLAGGKLQTTAYGIRYYLNLFSDFTYYLDNPVDGDQFNQFDNRKIFGWNGSWARLRYAVRQADPEHRRLGHPPGPDRTGGTVRHRSQGADFHDARGPGPRDQLLGLLRKPDAMDGDAAQYRRHARRELQFDVTSNVPQNSGSKTAGMGLPKLSLIYGPWNKSEFFINAGESFHSNDARGVVATVDPKTLEPIGQATPLVRGKGAEAGVRTEIVPNLQSSVAFWYLHLDSELVFSGDEGTTEPSRPSKRVGVEWSNHYIPLRWLLFDLDLAWTRARFTDDDPIGNHIPDSLQTTAQAGITIQNLGPWTASIFGRYFGPRDLIEDGSIQSNSTTVFNLQATHNLSPKARIRFDVFNLFDAQANDITYYYTSRLPGEPAAGVNDFHFHPMESRSFRLGLLYNF